MEFEDLLSYFEYFLNSNPHKIAAIDNNRSITFEELNLESDQLAIELNFNKIQYNENVGILLNRSVEYLISILAILKVGATFVPLVPELPVQKLNSMLKLASISKIISDQSLKNDFGQVLNINDCKLKNKNKKFQKIKFNHEEHVAYVIFTSGSTGEPKGVQVLESSLLNFLNAIRKLEIFSENSNALAMTTFIFDISLLEILFPLFCGGSVYLCSEEERINIKRLEKSLNKYKINFIQATPTFFKFLLANKCSIPRQSIIFCGGEKLEINLAKKLTSFFDEVYNLYGPTEATIWTSIKKIEKATDIVTIGKPLSGYEILIVDEKKRKVTKNTMGEILISGRSLFKGYLNHESRFIQIDQKSYYSSGDFGYLDDNEEIVFISRLDSQIKFLGQRIELEEICHHVLEIENISDALVADFEVEDESGSKDIRLGLLYSTQNLNILDSQEIKKKLSNFINKNIIPSEIIQVDSIPMLISGKKDLVKAREIFKQNPIRYNKEISQKDNDALEIWRKVLKKENVNPKESFFEIGGNSLMAVELIMLMNKKTGFHCSLEYLYKNNTLESFVTNLTSIEYQKNNFQKISTRLLIVGFSKNIFNLPFINVFDEVERNEPVIDKTQLSQLIYEKIKSRYELEGLEVIISDVMKDAAFELNKKFNIPVFLFEDKSDGDGSEKTFRTKLKLIFGIGVSNAELEIYYKKLIEKNNCEFNRLPYISKDEVETYK